MVKKTAAFRQRRAAERERLKNGKALPIFEYVLGGDDGRDWDSAPPRMVRR
jgi:hypothetical protein